MKRWKGIFLAFLLVLTQIPAAQAVGPSASSAILMEAGSGRVLYEHNADEPRLIASITKLMTALVALESGRSLDDVVTIQAEDTRTEGSALYLKPGERVKLETLLYGLLLHSGNDAALAIARFCGGSVEDFVAGMNAKARELGMTNSHFANPNGLNDEGHYASARDMALLARACLDNEYLAQMVSTRTITLEGRTFTNHNKLLWRYEGCVGMKTGFTEKAGRTLVSAARRDGMTLIAVTLNDPDDWADHAALFDYGFSSCTLATGVQEGETVGSLPVLGSLVPLVPVQAAEDLSWPLLEGETLETELELTQTSLTAPAAAGTQVGVLRGYVNGTQVGEVPLVCGAAAAGNLAEPQDPLQRLLGWFWN